MISSSGFLFMNCRNSANFSSYRFLVDSSLVFASSSCQYFRAVDEGYNDLMLDVADLLLCVVSGWVVVGLVCWT